MGRKVFTLVTNVVRKGDGQGRVNFEIVREALRQDWQVVLVATEIAAELENDSRVTWNRVSVRGIPSYLLRERVFALRSARALKRCRIGPLLSNGCITTVPADVNACHFVHSAWLASPLHPGKIRGGMHGAYHRLYSSVNARAEKGAYLAAGGVVSVSEQVRSELAAIGIPPARITTIPNGVDTDEFQPGPGDRARFGLPEGVSLALFAGDLRSPRKNLDTVLRALARVPALHLAVAGWLETSPYPAMAAAMGLSERVHFLGNVREMPVLMRSCDVFAFPSRYEACSLVMLEAMAAGLPVITTRKTGGSELVPPEGGFLMRDPDDEAGLVEILVRAASDRQGLAEMRAVSRSKALSLRWDEMGRKYLKLLESV
jgi:glycosyltransferase involved in cell wall biosynthesis